MLQGLDLKQVIKSGVIGSNNSAYVSFKYNGANKCAFNFMGVDPIENETFAEFLDRTSADINLEEWTVLILVLLEYARRHPIENETFAEFLS